MPFVAAPRAGWTARLCKSKSSKLSARGTRGTSPHPCMAEGAAHRAPSGKGERAESGARRRCGVGARDAIAIVESFVGHDQDAETTKFILWITL